MNTLKMKMMVVSMTPPSLGMLLLQTSNETNRSATNSYTWTKSNIFISLHYITIFVKLNLNINFLINQRIFLCLTLQKHLWSLDIILAIFFTCDLYYSLCLVITPVRGSHWSRTHASNHFFYHHQILIQAYQPPKKYYNHRKHIELLFHVQLFYN
jgi:hypothetical protein